MKPAYWCGPSYFDDYMITRKIKRYLSRRHNFLCKIHDDKYELKIGTRKEADVALLLSMRENSKTNNYFKKVLYFLEDYTFYFLIRILGITRWGKE